MADEESKITNEDSTMTEEETNKEDEEEEKSKQPKEVSFRQAIDTLAVAELELVGEARRMDPEEVNQQLKDKTSLAVDAMETYAMLLFDVTHDEIRDAVGQVDPNIIKNYNQKRVFMAANQASESQEDDEAQQDE